MINLFKNNRGLTLIEILISIGILSGIVFIVTMFGLDLFNFQIFLSDAFTMQQEINLTLTNMGIEVRSMGPSANGSYPIESASANSFTFFSDVDGDGAFERVRYFLAGNILRRGVIEPLGNPASYPTASESFKDVVHNIILPPIASQSLFLYYGDGYTGNQSPLSLPVSANDIRLIKVSITADRNPENIQSRLEYSSVILMRNLRNTQ